MDDLIDELLADDTTRAVDGDASSATKQPEWGLCDGISVLSYFKF